MESGSLFSRHGGLDRMRSEVLPGFPFRFWKFGLWDERFKVGGPIHLVVNVLLRWIFFVLRHDFLTG